jgi:hypothetical protein
VTDLTVRDFLTRHSPVITTALLPPVVRILPILWPFLGESPSLGKRQIKTWEASPLNFSPHYLSQFP